MKRLMRLAARLYPRAWRQRYGAELDALLDEMSPSWRDVVNVVQGALSMQATQLGVVAALAATGALVGIVVAINSPDRYTSTAVVRVHIEGSAAERKLPGEMHFGLRDVSLASRRATEITLARDRAMPGEATMTVAATAPDSAAAEASLNALMNQLLRPNTASVIPDPLRGLEVLATPSLATTPTRPNRVAFAGVGSVAGVMVGIVALLVRRRFLTWHR
jgi:LPS O-antigen subunit length determinant protein (WzzB/FepE family)